MGFNWVKNLFNNKRKPAIKYSLCGSIIPEWCIGDSVNTYKYNLSKKERKAIRTWYLTNTPNSIERIKTIKSNWIGTTFGTHYYSPYSKGWGGFMLCIGANTYVKCKI